MTHRYWLVDWETYIRISQHYFHQLVAQGYCSSVQTKVYKALKLVNHLCNL
jgi:hypothetical protein